VNAEDVGLLALRTYLIVTAIPLTVGLIVCRQAYAVFKSEMVSLILTALIGLPLTCLLGVWGVAWGFLLTRLFSRVYIALAFRRYLKSSPRGAPVTAAVDVASGLGKPLRRRYEEDGHRCTCATISRESASNGA
jgi:O-antigen/teichoic acid export membrane protein